MGGREPGQPREAQGQLVAALGAGERMHLVDDDGPEGGEDLRRIGIGEQQGQAFRRGQQDVRRLGALARALVGRRVAGAGLERIGRSSSSTGRVRLRSMSAASAFSGQT